MASPRVCVLRAPGTNCDAETAYAFESCGAKADRVHLFRLMERPGMLADYQILCVPGGFSYGDDLGSGVIFSAKMRGALKSSLSDFLAKDSLTLGICNGFQVLLKAGVLPDGTAGWDRHEKDDADATLTWNHNGKYTSRWIRCKVTTTNNVFLRDIDEIELPMAHAEGRLVVKDPATLSRWEELGQQALVYQDWQAHHSGAERSPLICERWPSNPNGSANDLAGIGDASGRVLGLMPHPERFIFGHQHPNWTRLDLGEWGHGRKIFQNAVEYYN